MFSSPPSSYQRPLRTITTLLAPTPDRHFKFKLHLTAPLGWEHKTWISVNPNQLLCDSEGSGGSHRDLMCFFCFLRDLLHSCHCRTCGRLLAGWILSQHLHRDRPNVSGWVVVHPEKKFIIYSSSWLSSRKKQTQNSDIYLSSIWYSNAPTLYLWPKPKGC